MDTIGGSTKVIFGSETGDMKVSEARWAALFSFVGGIALGSKVARSRARNGQDPFLGVFF